jgi:hypothetical protein
LLDKGGNWHTLPDLCDGSTESSVSQRICSFEMLAVSDSPLLLEQGDLIVARVRAGNDIGWGEFSVSNTEGQITQ